MDRAGVDVAVIGAGIVGLGHALAALDRGLTVAVIDRSAQLTGATIRNFGHLCISAQSGIAREYAEVSRELWLRLGAEAGFWVRESGTLVVARAADELELLASLGDGELMSADAVAESAPIAGAVGGLRLPRDLQVDPREAGPAIARHLSDRGARFEWQTSALGFESGVVHTTRGELRADTVIVAVNADIDQLFPSVAAEAGILRCGLDMLLIEDDLRFALPSPLLTGWSLLRYSAFAALPGAAAVRARLELESPELLALDLNQMYTQRPDGTVIVGDTHYRGHSISPFQQESSFDALAAITGEFFGLDRVRVRERWQGVYASAPDEFLVASPMPGVQVVSVTTGIGMTTALGLAETVIDQLHPMAVRRA